MQKKTHLMHTSANYIPGKCNTLSRSSSRQSPTICFWIKFLFSSCQLFCFANCCVVKSYSSICLYRKPKVLLLSIIFLNNDTYNPSVLGFQFYLTNLQFAIRIRFLVACIPKNHIYLLYNTFKFAITFSKDFKVF